MSSIENVGKVPPTTGFPAQPSVSEKERVFSRRPLLSRSPPERRMSSPNLLGGAVGQALKRRRNSDSNHPEDNLCSKFDSILKELNDLGKLFPKTAVDCINKLEKIKKQVNSLVSEEKHINTPRLMINAEAQTMSAREVEEAHQIANVRASLHEKMTNEEVAKVIKEEWHKNTYECTKVSKRSILNCKSLQVVIISANADSKETHSLVQPLCKTFPSLKKAMEQKPEPQRLIMAESSDVTQYIDVEENEPVARDNKSVIVGFLGNENKEENIFEMIRKIRKKVEFSRIKELSILATTHHHSELRKIVECIFAGADVRIEVCLSRKKDDPQNPPKRKPKTKRDSTITVGGIAGESFAEVVANLKRNISPHDIGIDVKRITKTPKGDIKLIVQEQKEGAKEEFAAKIRAETSGRVTTSQNKLSAVIVTNLDESINKEELKERIVKYLSCTPNENIQVGEIRKGHRGAFYSTILLPHEKAMQLSVQGSLIIGWTRATIFMKLRPECCKKCQFFGHNARTCQKEVRIGELCRKCGATDHKAINCKNEKRCYVCNESHRADSMACVQYRNAVARLRSSSKANHVAGDEILMTAEGSLFDNQNRC